MTADRVASVVPAADLPKAVAQWSGLLGVEPTFVDGDRWAQFDVGGGRIALAGTDRVHDGPGVMVRVPDLDAALERAAALGLAAGEVTVGPHERRCVVTGPDGCPVVLYSAG